jgi:hypothetical protein
MHSSISALKVQNSQNLYTGYPKKFARWTSNPKKKIETPVWIGFGRQFSVLKLNSINFNLKRRNF